ncbi:BTB domain-containing protein [Mycena indigotica]|uniref:BTB domain-containing protein n=1 Tax=Mycena indigotica TaxID=2126181 RepID=A0A8H6VV27_9AGAR|nr:BTB domain-containing protein [Mycena indigotica]KAF7291183.1 BTB domain-containing protein [Mycena indigotica]
MSSPATAPAPFSSLDAQPDVGPADFVLRSSDPVDFFVHKQTLAAASDFFSDLLTSPHTSAAADSPTRDGLPVLQLTEPKGVLLRVLKLAYRPTLPKPTITLKNIDTLIPVQQALDKYQFTALDSHFSSSAPRDMLELMRVGAANPLPPLRMFVVALLCGYVSAAQTALRVVARSGDVGNTEEFPEMGMLTWPQGREIERLVRGFGLALKEVVKVQTGYRPKEVDPIGLIPGHFRWVPTSAAPNPAPAQNLNPNPGMIQPFMPQAPNQPVVFVWWQPEGHAATCLSSHTSFQKRNLVTIGADTPLACSIFPRPATWFEEHVKALAAKGALLGWMGRHAVDERPTAPLAALGDDVEKVVRRCRLCAQWAPSHLGMWAEAVAGEVDKVDAWLDSNVARMVLFYHVFNSTNHDEILKDQ